MIIKIIRKNFNRCRRSLNSKTTGYRIYCRRLEKNSNDEIIKVGYGFNDKRYSWVNRFGEKYSKYYPGVYVRGREYDYILMRSYNLKNNQEGIQNRSIVDNDYIITYNVSNPPVQKENIILLKEIGRLNIYKLR